MVHLLVSFCLALILSFNWISSSSAQNAPGYIREVREFEIDEVGLSNPVGLAYSERAKAFHVLEVPRLSLPPFGQTDIVTISTFVDRKGSARIAASISDPINTAFDNRYNRLVILQPRARQLITVDAAEDGQLDPRTLTRFDARNFNLGDPQGMAVDPSNGDLFILDNAADQILIVESNLGSFEGAALSRFDLPELAGNNLHGLAFDQGTDNLQVFDLDQDNLYEVTVAGQVVGERDLSGFNIVDPQAIVIAPSGDQTDAPDQLHLYVADSGTDAETVQLRSSLESSVDALAVPSTQGSSGEIIEFSFVEIAQVEAATAFTSSLVQTIHTWQWNPPSPDPSGITYLTASNSLMVVDGEVNEMSIYDGANVFEATLQGNLIDTWNTLSFSNEPTGISINPDNDHLFISQDTPPKVVYELDPGPDGTYGSPDDDIVNSVITANFGSNDPEGVTYASGLNVLFIADGVNNEIYRLDPGNNGQFDGVPPAGDDQLTSFDTASLGLEDPEGVVYNPDNGHLYLAGRTPNIGTRNMDTLLEVTSTGSLVQTIDVSDANANKLSGLAYGPCSNNPGLRCIYIVDRAVDNNSDPNENDGEIYVMSLPGGATNSPPVANDDSANTPENTLVTIDVAANDSDPNGNLDPATTNTTCGTCSGTAPGSTLLNNGDGTFDYTPPNNFTGSDGFVYEICDSGSPSLCDTANVSITVTVANDPPVANNDNTSTNEDTLVVINVAANDTDNDGNLDPTTTNTACVTCSATSNGSLTNNGNGTFNYTPAANFNGSDAFTYEICDDLGACDTASVSITINPVNDPPVAVNDSVSTTETTPVVVDVAFNDTDVDGNLVASSANTGCAGCNSPGNGNLVNNGNGTFTYTADAGFTGSDSFIYEICDTTSLCDTATANITVSEQPNEMYVSSTSGGNIGGVNFDQEDILAFNTTDQTWSMYFDGTDVGLGSIEVDGFHVNADGSILLSIDPSSTLPDVGAIDDTDIVRFIPTSTGENTAGSYEMYFDGSLAGLAANTGEDIDALWSPPDGSYLIISTRGSYTIGGISGPDHDLLKFTPDSPGDFTSGTWEVYFDGSDVGLGDGGNNEDVNSVSIDSDGDIHLSARVMFSVLGVSGDSADIFTCTPSSIGEVTACTFSLLWDGSAYGFGSESVNGLTVEITGGQSNDPPVANSDNYSTDEDTLLNVVVPGVLTNDTDGDADPLTAVLQNTTSNGNLNLNTDGSFDYSPDPNFSGTDSFTYFANDGTANSPAPATVAITVNPVNDLPAAVDDSFSTDEDTLLTVTAPGVLGNDTDTDGDILTAVLQNTTSNGVLNLNSDGSFSYTPAENFNGTDSFTYFANDGTANSSSPATVTITVNPINDPPVAVDDTYATDEDTPLNVTLPGVLGNDSDGDGDPLTAVLQNTTTSGTLNLSSNGSFSYSPDADFNGTDSFTYFANDGTANSAAPATVTITVNSVNDPPVANDDSFSTDEDTPLNVAAPGVLNNDTDVEGDILNAVLQNTTSSGVLNLNSDGSFSYTPNANFFGTDSFTYLANDGTANSVSPATVTITVLEFNNLPLAVDDSYTTDEDTPLTVTAPGVLGNDSDGDSDPLTAVLQNTTPNGTLNLSSDGSYSYTPDADFNGTDSFTYFANDGTANSTVPATVTITVNSVNDPPVANDDSFSTDEDTPLNVAAPGVLGNDTDAEGDTLNAVLQNTTSNGILNFNSDGSFSYTPNANFFGTDSFTYFANDSTANSPTPATVTITVLEFNNLPVANNDNYTTDEDTPLNIAAPGVLTNDTDADFDPLTAILQNSTTNGSLTLNANGSFDYTPNPNFFGTDSFTYFANDGTANSTTPSTVTITVNSINDPPAAVDDSFSTDEDTPLNVAAPGVLGNDMDADGDSLNAVLQNTTSNGILNLNSDGSFSYSPAANFNGTDSFTYFANDGTANSAPAAVTITVNPVNDLPAAGNDSYTTDEDTPLNVAIPGVLGNDTDGDSDTLTALLQNTTSNGILNLNSDGSFTFTPDANFNGTDTFTYFANDGKANSPAPATVTITVNSVNDPPVANDDTASTNADTPVVINVAANDSDADGNLDPASANVTSGPSNGGVSNNGDGTITYTPDPGYNGSDSFVYEICDTTSPTSLCDTATVDITVSGQQILYVSSTSGGNAGGISFNDEDILAYDLNTLTWEMFFDGSVVGLGSGGQEIDAFHINPDGSILLSVGSDGTIPDLGSVDDSDIVKFTPTSPGDFSAGTYSWYFDGSDVDLSSSGEDIVAMGFAPDGRLVISPRGSFSVTGVSGDDQDLLIFTDTLLGATTSGSWELYFDGSAIPLAVDINGTWIDTNGDIYLSVRGTFSVPGVAGEAADIFRCTPGSVGPITSCTFSSFWVGAENGFGGEDTNGIFLSGGGGGSSNSPPVAADDSATTAQDTPVTINVAANDSDPNGNLDSSSANTDCPTCSTPSSGGLVNNGNGSFDYTPSPGFTGSDGFNYEICDQEGLCDTASVSITVTVSNDPPVANNDSATTDEDTAVIIDVATNDNDPDGNMNPGTANSICANGSTGCNGAANGSLGDNGDGSITYTPNPDFNGADSFVYEICDTLGACSTATVTVTVNPINDPPVAVDDSSSTPVDTLVTIDVAANDTDIDGNLSPATANTACGVCSNPANGTLANNANGTFDYSPSASFSGQDSFVYEICDSLGACDTAAVTINVQSQASLSTLYVSSNSGGSIGGINFTDGDILAYELATGTWSIYFDGSDVGFNTGGQELDAFHIDTDGSILLSLGSPGNLPGLPGVDDYDVVRFTPTTLGENNTSGSFAMFLNGEAYELSTNGEDIDAIGVAPDGRLVISTRGYYSVGGISGGDEDLLIFNSGTWDLYVDGTNVGLEDGANSEDVNGIWLDPNGDIYMSVRGTYSVPGLTGDADDIFMCTPVTPGDYTSCNYQLFWDGSTTAFLGEVINGFHLGQ